MEIKPDPASREALEAEIQSALAELQTVPRKFLSASRADCVSQIEALHGFSVESIMPAVEQLGEAAFSTEALRMIASVQTRKDLERGVFSMRTAAELMPR